jgi:hypothetical protein
MLENATYDTLGSWIMRLLACASSVSFPLGMLISKLIAQPKRNLLLVTKLSRVNQIRSPEFL